MKFNQKSLEEVGEDAKISFDLQTASGSSPNMIRFSLKDTNEKRLDEAVTQLNEELKEHRRCYGSIKFTS